MREHQLVTSLEELQELAYRPNGDFVHFYVSLAGGLARSSKRISYRPEFKEFLLIHEIDESYEEIREDTLGSQTNLIESMQKGCFFCCE
ncbi:MAG: hypothetical protein K9J17_14100 [Flavobacteriales bacterium]|nr:hypothetical protein [Flavobacteriales bacterium]